MRVQLNIHDCATVTDNTTKKKRIKIHFLAKVFGFALSGRSFALRVSRVCAWERKYTALYCTASDSHEAVFSLTLVQGVFNEAAQFEKELLLQCFRCWARAFSLTVLFAQLFCPGVTWTESSARYCRTNWSSKNEISDFLVMRNHPEIALLPRHSGNTCVMTYVLAAQYTCLKTPWVFYSLLKTL